MVNAKELRIGNWLQGMTINTPFYVSAVDILEIDKRKGNVDLEPILMTLEIMQQCGFNYEQIMEGRKCYFNESGYGFTPADDGGILFVLRDGHIVDKSFYYVHTVQNLYFDHTGEQLLLKQFTSA
jgi:hypothetical protein